MGSIWLVQLQKQKKKRRVVLEANRWKFGHGQPGKVTKDIIVKWGLWQAGKAKLRAVFMHSITKQWVFNMASASPANVALYWDFLVLSLHITQNVLMSRNPAVIPNTIYWSHLRWWIILGTWLWIWAVLSSSLEQGWVQLTFHCTSSAVLNRELWSGSTVTDNVLEG